MKKSKLVFSAAVGSVMTLAAIERPGGGEKTVPAEPQGGILGGRKKEANDQIDEQQAPAAQAVKKVAYLGVGGGEISEALKVHLEIESGLLLSTVAQDSPAGLSGLKKNDILLSINEVGLTDQNSLRRAMANHKPGDVVSLKLIRRGKEIEQELTLGESPVNRNIPPMALVPDPAAEMNKLLNGQFDFRLGGLENGEIEKQLMEQLRKAFGDRAEMFGKNGGFRQLDFEMPDLGGNQGGGFQAFGSVNLQDENGSVQMKSEGGKRTVIVKDREGTLLYEGPYNTDEDKKAVPEDLRERVEKLDMGNGRNGFRFNFRALPQGKQGQPEGE
jgi:hypothetical protein